MGRAGDLNLGERNAVLPVDLHVRAAAAPQQRTEHQRCDRGDKVKGGGRHRGTLRFAY